MTVSLKIDRESNAAARLEEDGSYAGQRMTADAFLEIQDDGRFYELVDGVVIVSPSPSPRHQQVLVDILLQLGNFLQVHPVGKVFAELDVHLGAGPTGGDIVLRPELMFIRGQRLSEIVRPDEKVHGPPDLVVEIVSRGSRRIDTKTKKRDYERFGVREYWLIDPARK
jgi:Uma2 family endonuclease